MKLQSHRPVTPVRGALGARNQNGNGGAAKGINRTGNLRHYLDAILLLGNPPYSGLSREYPYYRIALRVEPNGGSNNILVGKYLLVDLFLSSLGVLYAVPVAA